MTEQITPKEFRDGLAEELFEELHRRCIIYEGMSGLQMKFRVELTDEAYMLLGAIAMAHEIHERQNND